MTCSLAKGERWIRPRRAKRGDRARHNDREHQHVLALMNTAAMARNIVCHDAKCTYWRIRGARSPSRSRRTVLFRYPTPRRNLAPPSTCERRGDGRATRLARFETMVPVARHILHGGARRVRGAPRQRKTQCETPAGAGENRERGRRLHLHLLPPRQGDLRADCAPV
jgi:hypothetical protein